MAGGHTWMMKSIYKPWFPVIKQSTDWKWKKKIEIDTQKA